MALASSEVWSVLLHAVYDQMLQKLSFGSAVPLCSNVMHAGILNLKDGQDFILKQIEELGWSHVRSTSALQQ
jgi:hypothetical protein